MNQFNNFRRSQTWNSRGQGLLPNPTFEQVQRFGCQQPILPNFDGSLLAAQPFTSNLSTNNYQNFSRAQQQQQLNQFNASYNLLRPQQEQFLGQQSQQHRQQNIAPLLSVNASRWRNDNSGEKWKQKRNNQRSNKNKLKWDKKRQRNPSRQNKPRKNQKTKDRNRNESRKSQESDDDCWNRSDADGSVYVIDEDMEEMFSASKDKTNEVTTEQKAEDETNAEDNNVPDSTRGNIAAQADCRSITSPTMDRSIKKIYSPEISSNHKNEVSLFDSTNEEKTVEDEEVIENLQHEKILKSEDNVTNTRCIFEKTVTDTGVSSFTNDRYNDQNSDHGDDPPAVEIISPPFKPVTSSMQEKLNNYPAPLIGVNYVVERQSENVFCEPKYDCNLCDVKCDGRSLLAHITGSEHRLTYMMKHCKEDYDRLSKSRFSKDEFAVQLIRAAERIQRVDGRGQLQIKQEFASGETVEQNTQSSNLSPSSTKNWPIIEQDNINNFSFNASDLKSQEKCENSFDASNNKPDQNEKQVVNKIKVFPKQEENISEYSNLSPSVLSDPNPLQEVLREAPENLSLSGGSLGTLLTILSKCIVKNEEDAQMALQVSNALTESLFKYRVRNMTPEVISSNLTSDGLKVLIGSTNVGEKLLSLSSENSGDRQKSTNFH